RFPVPRSYFGSCLFPCATPVGVLGFNSRPRRSFQLVAVNRALGRTDNLSLRCLPGGRAALFRGSRRQLTRRSAQHACKLAQLAGGVGVFRNIPPPTPCMCGGFRRGCEEYAPNHLGLGCLEARCRRLAKMNPLLYAISRTMPHLYK